MWYKIHQSLTMAIGIFATVAILIYIGVLPIYRNIQEISKSIETKSKELDSMSNKVAILSNLDINILDDRVKTIDSALPASKDVLLYLNSIDGLSRELGLTFGGLSLAPGDITEATGAAKQATTKKDGLQTLATEIKIQGTQESIYTFLRTIEGVLPLMQIKDIKVGILGGNQYTLSLTLAMLWAEPTTSSNTNKAEVLFNADDDKYFSVLSKYRKFEPQLYVPEIDERKQDLFSPITINEIVPVVSEEPSVKPSAEVTPQQ